MKKLLGSIFIHISSLNFTIILLVMFLLTILADTLEGAILSFCRGMNLPGERVVSNLLNHYFAADVHTSRWFKMLLMLFILNLLACMVKRVPGTFRALSPNGAAAARTIPAAPLFHDTFTLTGLRREFYRSLYKMLAVQWSKPSVHHNTTRSVFFCQRGSLSHGGFYLAHGGLLLLLAGGIVGSSALSGEMYLKEGESDDKIFLRKNGTSCFQKLDYTIRLDRHESITSPAGSPNFSHPISRSIVTVLREGKKDVRGSLEGYKTLTTDGIRIGLARSPVKDSRHIQLSIRSRNAGGTRRTFSLRRFQCRSIPETGHTVRLKDIHCSHHDPRVSFQKVPLASFSSCVAVLEVYGNDRSLLYTPYVTAHAGSPAQPWDKDYEFFIAGVKDGETASDCMRLIISTEPGGKLIWAGVGISIAGFSLILLLSHRKIWVIIEKGGGGCRITIVGWASRNPDILKHYAGRIKDVALQYRAV